MLIGYVALSARLVLAAILLAAAAGKTRGFREFAIPLRGLGLPGWLAAAATGALIACEALLGGLLATGLWPPIAVPATAALLAGFAGVSVYAVASGRQIACNCFGRGSSSLGWRTFARALLMGVALAAYATAPPSTVALTGPDLVRVGSLAAGMLLLGSWVLVLPTLAALVRQRRRSVYEVGLLLSAPREPEGWPITVEEAR